MLGLEIAEKGELYVMHNKNNHLVSEDGFLFLECLQWHPNKPFVASISISSRIILDTVSSEIVVRKLFL